MERGVVGLINQRIDTITDPKKKRWQSDVIPLPSAEPKPPQLHGGIDVESGRGNDAEALQAAFDRSVDRVAAQFNQLKIKVEGKVPSSDWAKAEQATGRTVRLSSDPLVMDRPVYMLSHTALVGHDGAGLFDCSNQFEGGLCGIDLRHPYRCWV